MSIYKDIPKIKFSEALKMEESGHTLWHIEWMQQMANEFTDCSFVVVQQRKDWRDVKSRLAAVLSPTEIQYIRYQIKKLKKENGSKIKIEMLEEKLNELNG